MNAITHNLRRRFHFAPEKEFSGTNAREVRLFSDTTQ
jgi:hypothetical protein